MTDRLTETVINDWLIDTDVDAHAPGCYAVALETPDDDADAVARRWADHYDAPMPDGVLERLTAADRLAYVGSHGRSVYDRLCQHARGHKSASIMDVWAPVAVVDVWAVGSPDVHEYNYAIEQTDDETVVWCDGGLV